MPVSWVGTSWSTVLPLTGRLDDDPTGALSGPVAWGTTTLLPAALVLAVVALRLTRHDVEDHHTRARVVLAGGLLTTAACTVALRVSEDAVRDVSSVTLAASVAVLVWVGAVIVGQYRVSRSAVRAVALAVGATGATALLPLAGQPSWITPGPAAALLAVLGTGLAVAHHRAMPLGAGFTIDLPVDQPLDRPTRSTRDRVLTAP